MAIVGLILGIAGILLSCCGCGLILCPIGLVLSIVAHNRRPGGLSLAGIIIGSVGTLMFVAYMVYVVYMSAHPAMYEELIKRMFDQMGMPVPPNFPGR